MSPNQKHVLKQGTYSRSFSMPLLATEDCKDSCRSQRVPSEYFMLSQYHCRSLLLVPFFEYKISALLSRKTRSLGLPFHYQDWTSRFCSLGNNPPRTGQTRPACCSGSWTSCFDLLGGSPWRSGGRWRLAPRVRGPGRQLLQTQWWGLRKRG